MTVRLRPAHDQQELMAVRARHIEELAHALRAYLVESNDWADTVIEDALDGIARHSAELRLNVIGLRCNAFDQWQTIALTPPDVTWSCDCGLARSLTFEAERAWLGDPPTPPLCNLCRRQMVRTVPGPA